MIPFFQKTRVAQKTSEPPFDFHSNLLNENSLRTQLRQGEIDQHILGYSQGNHRFHLGQKSR